MANNRGLHVPVYIVQVRVSGLTRPVNAELLSVDCNNRLRSGSYAYGDRGRAADRSLVALYGNDEPLLELI